MEYWSNHMTVRNVAMIGRTFWLGANSILGSLSPLVYQEPAFTRTMLPLDLLQRSGLHLRVPSPGYLPQPNEFPDDGYQGNRADITAYGTTV